MSKNFMDKLAQSGNISITENGAIGHYTTFNAFVDFNFRVPSYRADKASLRFDFLRMWEVDQGYAMKMLFYLRDIRQGMGERDSFRYLLEVVSPSLTLELVRLIPEYGRWDDMLSLMGTVAEPLVILVIRSQLLEDLRRMDAGKSVSLLAKWLPSTGSRNKIKRSEARVFAHKLGLLPKDYHRFVTQLRTHLRVVEKSMSQGKWNEIEYSAVPSKANLLYSVAFMRHDEARRKEYLTSLTKGESKINAGAVFPHDVLAKVYSDQAVANAMWKELPNFMPEAGATIVVQDTSGSMISRIGDKGNTTAMQVAQALSIYCSERLSGVYKDKVITFSSIPRYIDLGNLNTLGQKVHHLDKYNIIENTNIERVFELILNTAIENNIPQEDMVDNILIISDMEFDSAQDYHSESFNETLFQAIERKFTNAGYKIPNLVFWNVNSRTNTIPTYKDNTKLISGFSPAVLQQVFGLNESAWDGLKRVLDSERYQPITLN